MVYLTILLFLIILVVLIRLLDQEQQNSAFLDCCLMSLQATLDSIHNAVIELDADPIKKFLFKKMKLFFLGTAG